jgi:hypothetical protein
VTFPLTTPLRARRKPRGAHAESGPGQGVTTRIRIVVHSCDRWLCPDVPGLSCRPAAPRGAGPSAAAVSGPPELAAGPLRLEWPWIFMGARAMDRPRRTRHALAGRLLAAARKFIRLGSGALDVMRWIAGKHGIDPATMLAYVGGYGAMVAGRFLKCTC